mmetsp:Transcript_40231/g.119957  ORF Transcript_40231/g.119957 Transcript_40231/m.119957 type:complete len:1026 (-) Transcript_40231:846-3923(-)
MATFKEQSNALLRKSTVYQKREICTNVCLLSAPIFFSILLLVIQLLINNLFLTGPDFECGCQCLQCCYNNDANNCTLLESGFCDEDEGFECRSYNTTKCGLQYSSAEQSAFCPIPYPSNWPALTLTPEAVYRVDGDKPATTMLTTADSPVLASGIGALLVNQLAPAASSLLGLLDLIAGNATTGRPGIYETPAGSTDGVFNGYLLSELGMQMGSSVEPLSQNYLETSFQTPNETYVLLPQSACQAAGLSQTEPVSLIDFLAAYGSLVGLSGFAGDSIFNASSIMVTCTDTVIDTELSASDINTAVYCGYYQARCNGTQVLQQYTGAYDFYASSASGLSADVYYNGTFDGEGQDGQLPNLRIPAAVNLAVKAWFRYFVSQDASDVVPPTSLLAIMSMPKQATELKLDFSSLLGPLFYTWVVQLLFPTFLQQLVYEKEKRLRMMMKMHGLGDGAYWLVTYCWFTVLYIAYIAVFIIFGSAVGLQYFRKTNYGIQIIFYLLHGQCMIASAFLVSSFFTSSLTAVVFAYLYVFASGLIGSLLLQTFMNQNQLWVFFIEWVPAWSLYRGLYEIGQYAFLGVYRGTTGMQFDDLTASGNGMLPVWGIFIVEAFLFMLLGWYFEQVIASGNGTRRHWLFFLDSCRGRRKASAAEVALIPRAAAVAEGDAGPGGDEAINVKDTLAGIGQLADVEAERARVEDLLVAGATGDESIIVRDLHKVFPGRAGVGRRVAVESLTLAVGRGECFGLLGPNGAGKSTAINMLTGLLDVSGGQALIEGLPLGGNMDQIYKLMGTCPQHDLLWEQLTAEEHLLFYGRLKGLQKDALADAVTESLKSVNLLNWRNKPAGKFSGGMKRRLSVAISFMGQPKVVYLDEPSTGLDPASRRQLWEVVKGNREGRACILTTHSMEEAEALCDRLGIFVDGRLVCIGNPKEITSRYAGYYVFTITVPPEEEAMAKQLVDSMSSNAVLTYALGGTLKYELPTCDISLSGVFESVNAVKSSMTIYDWGVANATLEEVFIKFARATNMTMAD